MSNAGDVKALAHQVHVQHRELHRMISEISSLVQQLSDPQHSPAASGQLKGSVQRLRAFLERHFKQEEEGGWLEEAAARLPRLSHALTELEYEHRAILSQLDAAVAQLDGPATLKTTAAAPIQALIETILGHEAREEEVLAEGFNQGGDFIE